MFPDAYQTDVSSAISSYLQSGNPGDRSQILRECGELMLRPEADGFLAVLAAMNRQNLPFRDRVEILRLCLDEARHGGYDGRPRERYSYFAPFDTYGTALPPAPAEVAAEEEMERGTANAVFAFADSWDWSERHRIALAFPTLFASDLPASLCEDLAPKSTEDTILGTPEFWTALAEILREMQSKGADFLRDGSLPSVFTPGQPSPFQPVIFEGNEHVQLLVLAFSEAPTWEMRKRMVAENSELLGDDATELLRMALNRGYDAETTRRFELCVQVLDQARSDGLSAFDGDLPPTGMRPTPGAARRLGATLQRGEYAAAVPIIRQCLHFTDPVLAPRQWAQWNKQLAAALSHVSEPALRAMYSEEAILRIRATLSVYGLQEDPANHLESLEIYGTVLANRSRGDKASTLATARECFEAAYQGFTERGDVPEAARAEMDLAGALSLMPRPPLQEADLIAAQQHAADAAQAFARSADRPSLWQAAVIQAGALLRRAEVFHRHDVAPLDTVIQLLEQVLAQPDLANLVTPSRLLAQAFLARARVRPSNAGADYAGAIASLRRCLDRTPKEADPWLWAHAQDLLGTVYFRSGPDDDKRLWAAVRHHQDALDVFGPAMPAERRHVLVALSTAYFRLGRWEECRAVLDEATSLGDTREWITLSEYGQFGEIEELQNAHERYAYALLRCGEPGQALIQLDLGKTRAQRKWLGVQTGQPRHEPVAPRSLMPADGALIFPVVTPRGTAVWILTEDPTEPVHGEVLELPDVTETDLRRVLDGDDGREGWFSAYARFLSVMLGMRGIRGATDAPGAPQTAAAGDGSGADAAVRAWGEAIDATAHELSRLLAEPVAAVLRRKGLATGADVVILPSKWLSLLPLHAAWERRPEGGRRYFGNEFTISYAPSLFVLREAGQRAAARTGHRRSLLGVCDPALAEAPAEVAEVAQHFQPHQTLTLRDDSATVAAFMGHSPRFSHIHLACHGAFSETDPWDSSLYLNENEELKVGALAQTSVFGSAQLVTLSSCESGVTDFQSVPLEFIGLASAFLQAGAPCVLSCLWSVEDRATRILMSAFYAEYLENGSSPARALQIAQRRVRRDPEYAHPYFWAAFVLIGAGSVAADAVPQTQPRPAASRDTGPEKDGSQPCDNRT